MTPIINTQNKIAEITLSFWILKIIATTLGETAGDMLSMSLGMGYVVTFLVTSAFLLVLLFFQIRAEKFHSVLFWTTIIGTTTVGTEISDMMDRSFHFGYFLGSIILFCSLLLTLGIWFLQDNTLSIYPIYRKASEVFFWISVLFSNSLGTAFGDFLTDDLGLSYLMGALVSSAVIGGVLWVHCTTKINATFLFWIAFIFTRPFGATFGDFLTKPHSLGGLALNRTESSSLLLVLFFTILYVSNRKKPIKKQEIKGA